MAVVVAIDAGTTGVRALAVDEYGQVVDVSYRELTQHFPAPGLVEHDAAEIWTLVETTLAELQAKLSARSVGAAAIGITNQRETAVAWDRSSGRPLHRAIVWQDRRTAARCLELAQAGNLPQVRARTGLVLDPYFSATKWSWIIEHGGVEPSGSLALGTVDDWVCWNLTGGAGGSGVHATDASNASRTLCYDIQQRSWSPELCDLFGVPLEALGEVLPSAGRFGTVASTVAGGAFKGVPVSGIAGDQQAALFGHGCHEPGDTKVTYGTGSFVLMNLGREIPPPAEGVLTTVAWDLGAHAPPGAGDGFAYALEGAVFSSGATIQWLRDGLESDRPSGRGRPARGRDPQQRRRLPCPGVYRPRQPVVGPRGAAARSSASPRAPDGRTSLVRPSRPSPISAATCSTQWATLPAGQSTNCAPTVESQRWTSFCNSKPIRQASRSPAPGRPRSRHWAPQCWRGSPKESGGRSRICRP